MHKRQLKLFIVHIKNYVILAYHCSIKIYSELLLKFCLCIGLSLAICIVWRHFFTGLYRASSQMSKIILIDKKNVIYLEMEKKLRGFL